MKPGQLVYILSGDMVVDKRTYLTEYEGDVFVLLGGYGVPHRKDLYTFMTEEEYTEYQRKQKLSQLEADLAKTTVVAETIKLSIEQLKGQ